MPGCMQWLIMIVALGTGLMSGCSSDAPAATEDSRRARETLVTALEAWKRGEPAALSQHAPPIRFADDDLGEGAVLIDYEIENSDRPIAPFENVPVKLVLRDRQGKTNSRSVTYQVSISAGLAVLRSDP